MKPEAPKPEAPKLPAPNPTVDRRLAKDVAKELDRRRRRRKLLFWAALVGVVVLAALYLTCGSGFGLGGKGKGEGSGAGPGSGSVAPLLAAVDAGPRQCNVRIAANGITVDGTPATVAEAVAACKTAVDAKVLVTGGARMSDWEELKAAFDGAGIKVYRAEPTEGGGGSAGGGSAGGGSAGGGSAGGGSGSGSGSGS